ncbi:hypothetical protein PFTANZ_01063 [Plasmodium falciparum Tanzania (2000708)]|uniref:Uncharacterized protein n=1 Tax=Plasmodium falciparum Tanzania (2000708) TaxID=1036725 RepID=A0A024WDD6_PLAFA|nr:hypothetical protein PFTANZ_01063 [Plasmodium falciparum Tanzania (2000708)]
MFNHDIIKEKDNYKQKIRTLYRNENNGEDTNKNNNNDDINNNICHNNYSSTNFYKNFFQHFNCGNIFNNPNYSNEIVLTNTTCLSVHFNSNVLCNSQNIKNKNTIHSLENIKEEHDHTKNPSNFFLETNTYYDLNLTKSVDGNN